jgi:hypothetical protein
MVSITKTIPEFSEASKVANVFMMVEFMKIRPALSVREKERKKERKREKERKKER